MKIILAGIFGGLFLNFGVHYFYGFLVDHPHLDFAKTDRIAL
jgi:hypothetical protein